MSDNSVESVILLFVKNRVIQNETTTSRHIHRRFDIPMDHAEKILSELAKKNLIEQIKEELTNQY